MSLEINLEGSPFNVELMKKEDNHVTISINNKIYDVDIMMVEDGAYSIIIDNKSYSVELVKGKSNKDYTVNTLYNVYNIEIIDAQAKYLKNRSNADLETDENRIFSPMPGKVVKIPVKVGDKLESGQTAIIVEAMKMQSEYKVTKDKVIKEILVEEGSTIDGDQTLIVLE